MGKGIPEAGIEGRAAGWNKRSQDQSREKKKKQGKLPTKIGISPRFSMIFKRITNILALQKWIGKEEQQDTAGGRLSNP